MSFRLFAGFRQAFQKKFFRVLSSKPLGLYSLSLSVVPSSVLALSLLKREDKTEEILIAKSISYINNDKYKEADVCLHSILPILANQLKQGQINHVEYAGKRARVFSEMANLSLLNSDLPTAEKLLVQTIHDCLAAGIDQTSPIIAELSLKLALVYSRLGQFDRAFEGFKFCTSAQDALNIDLTISNSSNSEDLNEKKNKIALIGMICNYFSKFLYDRGEYNEALKYSQRALEAARVIYTNGHSNCLCLMSDIAAIQMHIPEKQESVRDILFEAIDLVKRRIRSDFSAFKFPSEANTSQNSDCVQPREIQSNQSAAEPNDFSRKSHIVKKLDSVSKLGTEDCSISDVELSLPHSVASFERSTPFTSLHQEIKLSDVQSLPNLVAWQVDLLVQWAAFEASQCLVRLADMLLDTADEALAQFSAIGPNANSPTLASSDSNSSPASKGVHGSKLSSTDSLTQDGRLNEARERLARVRQQVKDWKLEEDKSDIMISGSSAGSSVTQSGKSLTPAQEREFHGALVELIKWHEQHVGARLEAKQRAFRPGWLGREA